MAEEDKPVYPAFPKHNRKYTEEEAALENRKNADKRELSTTFITDFLYHGEHGRVAVAANGSNFYSWLNQNRNQLSETEIKEIVTQILMAVNRFHKRKKLHRDIKSENFLVFVTDTHPRRIHIKLADLDTLMADDDKLLSKAGTIGFLAPECTVSIEHDKEGQKVIEENLDDDKYIVASKKPVDCYAVGKTIDDILHYAYPDATSENQALRALCSSLTNNDPLQRMTIDAAMDSPYFGENPEAREIYFKQVREKHKKPDDYFNGIYKQLPYPEYNDALLLLSESLQKIYAQAHSLKMQMLWVHETQYPLEEKDKTQIEAAIAELKQLIKAEYNRNPKIDIELIQAFADIGMGMEKAETILAENALKKDISPDFNKSFIDNIKAEKYITSGYLKNYFIHENLLENNELLTFLQSRSDPQKRRDLKQALLALNEFIDELKNEKDSHVRTLLQNYYKTVFERRLSDIPLDDIPYVTELTHRLMFKVKHPTLDANQETGTNTVRAMEATHRISHFKWGRFLGGLALFIMGAAVTVIAGCSIAASFGSTSPFALALAKLGVEASAIGAVYAFSEVVHAFYKRRLKRGTLFTTATVASSVPLASCASGTTTVLATDIANEIVNVTTVSASVNVASAGLAAAAGIAGTCKGLYRMFTHHNRAIIKTAEPILKLKASDIMHAPRLV